MIQENDFTEYSKNIAERLMERGRRKSAKNIISFLVFGRGSGNKWHNTRCLTFLDFLDSCTFSINSEKKKNIDGLIKSSESNNFFTMVSRAPVETERMHLFRSLQIEIVD